MSVADGAVGSDRERDDHSAAGGVGRCRIVLVLSEDCRTGVPQGAKLRRLLPASLVALVVIASVLWLLIHRHKAGTPAPPANIAGEWEATVKYDWEDTYHDWFDFEVDGRELSGIAGFLGTRTGQGLPIWDGTIAGDRISFTTKSHTSISGDDKTYEDKHY